MDERFGLVAFLVYNYFVHYIEENMIDMILSPLAVVRKLIFPPSPLIQNNEGGKETKKTVCKRKRKLINVAQNKSVSYSYMAFGNLLTMLHIE